MSTLEERKRRGAELMKRYRVKTADALYSSAVDAIADILLFIAQSEDEASQLLQSAEMDFRTVFESEQFVSEG